MTEFRINITSNSSFPLFINEKNEKDLFRDVLLSKQQLESIHSMDDLKHYIFDYLECKNSFILDMFFKKVTFDQISDITIHYRFEQEDFIETGKIVYDVIKDVYTSSSNRENNIQEVIGVFGEEDMEDWPDSWFDVEFENSMITKFLNLYKVEMKDNKYKTNSISDTHKCPFYGAFNKNQLTKTIISYFATYTKNNPDFIQSLVQNQILIENSFQTIKGSYAYFDVENPKCSKGADFELIDQEIVYNHRENYGGW